jgi:N-acetylneuraminate synthase
MKINNHDIQKGGKVFVIAEIGMNHNGSVTRAKKLIDHASAMKVDCVKFQMRSLKDLYSKDALNISSGDLSTQYTLNLLKKFELSQIQFKKLSDYAKQKKIIFMCTPWDKKSVDNLEKLQVPAYKVASADLTNIDLIGHILKTKKPVILSTGMSNEKEIDMTVKYLKAKDACFALLHTNSTYPTPLKDINLNYIDKLIKKHNIPVGYSGHDRGILSTLSAVAKGACIIERHITLDKSMEGPDHAASLDIEEFKQFMSNLNELEVSLGSENDRVITQGEMINRENLSKSIYSSKDIKIGSKITRAMLDIKSPGQGISPQNITKIIGKTINKHITKGKPLFLSDFKKIIKPKNNYKFKSKWGIPVRLHDAKRLLRIVKPDIIEFHMSYNDLDENFNAYLNINQSPEFLVHAPELFKDDHLLNLCSDNIKYRKLSIEYLQDVINKTIKLKKYFPATETPMIVINCGGFSKDSFMPLKSRNKYYNILAESFKSLNHKGTYLLPQNMAPFPWHFGGQRYQNLFMDPNEIIKFCKKTGLYICHDLSHSHMACNHYKIDHIKYTEILSPYVKHYHIADAFGVDGEGLQIGEGTVDFPKNIKSYQKNQKLSNHLSLKLAGT